jgi:hypothetical protein
MFGLSSVLMVLVLMLVDVDGIELVHPFAAEYVVID